jgi:hypothetical protein
VKAVKIPKRPYSQETITIERLERRLAIAAYVVIWMVRYLWAYASENGLARKQPVREQW